MKNYYEKIYLEHKKKDVNKTPAPKNFWPYSYQFYMCNPIKIFSCIVKNANHRPHLTIEYYIEPQLDRSRKLSEMMPINILNKDELGILSKQIKIDLKELKEKLPFVSEELRAFLPLRDTDKISEAKQPYQRN
jgi:hypothetical protein